MLTLRPGKNQRNVKVEVIQPKSKVTVVEKPQKKKASYKAPSMNSGKGPTQQTLSKLDSAARGSPEAEYLRCIVNPREHQTRIPDGMGPSTSLYVSRRVLPIFVNTTIDTTDGNYGRFAVMVRPTLGSAADPQLYQVNQVDSSQGWPVSLDSESSFVAYNGSDDLRVDPNAEVLTQPPLSFQFVQGQNANRNSADVFSRDSVLTQTTTVGGKQVQLPIMQGFTKDEEPAPPGTTGGNSLYFTLPTGQYLMTLSLAFSITVFSGDGPAVADVQPSFTGLGGVVAHRVTNDGTKSPNSGNNIILYQYDQVYIVSSTNALGTEKFKLTLPAAANLATVTNAKMFLSPTWVPAVNEVMDGGIISTVRPVAMSLYYRSELADLNNGGNVAMFQLDQNAAKKFFSNTANQQSPAKWEYYVNLGESMAYAGRLQHGSYAYWTSNTIEDYEFKSIDRMVKEPPGGIVFAGQFSPGANVPSQTQYKIGQLEICMVYEGVDSSTIFEKERSRGYLDTANHVRQTLLNRGVPQFTDNDTHVEKIFKKVGNIVGDVAKIAGAVGPILGMIF